MRFTRLARICKVIRRQEIDMLDSGWSSKFWCLGGAFPLPNQIVRPWDTSPDVAAVANEWIRSVTFGEMSSEVYCSDTFGRFY
ncbi:hypothetical protein TNIN_230331 [Trichonephila inaurata madagascariensis]|uniref:Uncharacterized protein n=1 Tax=Trichonephila inaurata madagascariensis TaxID=2747483 RepID=A0A8X7C0A7_9ARAC|nr:hypothetical protein TNIN_230331 [Trichonephila inaurata madagascariensis]